MENRGPYAHRERNVDDLTTMWNEFKGERCVLLWIKCQKPNAVKRSQLTSSKPGPDDGVEMLKTKCTGEWGGGGGGPPPPPQKVLKLKNKK